ncbi:30S ribosomal protein S3 [Striga asiatica]|uniref:30S ribosomal protein S3 n=1 Tax=Striga asiatica TaxID=4170 RepID=A0A5A7PVT3_STRAF|nr:30S ribosomal protein S3 [Striga asiatica]
MVRGEASTSVMILSCSRFSLASRCRGEKWNRTSTTELIARRASPPPGPFFVAENAWKRSLRLHAQVCHGKTSMSISPSLSPRQCPDRYAFRAGRNLPDKEFRYLRTVYENRKAETPEERNPAHSPGREFLVCEEPPQNGTAWEQLKNRVSSRKAMKKAIELADTKGIRIQIL